MHREGGRGGERERGETRDSAICELFVFAALFNKLHLHSFFVKYV